MPLNIAWLAVLFLTIIVAVFEHFFGHQDHDARSCLSASHITVIVYVGLVAVFMGWFTKRWMVKKEAGAGRGCRGAQDVLFVDVPGLLQSKMGAGALVMILIACFAKDWYESCFKIPV